MPNFAKLPATITARTIAVEEQRLRAEERRERARNPGLRELKTEKMRHRAVVVILARWHARHRWWLPGFDLPGAALPEWKPRPRVYGGYQADVEGESRNGWFRIIEAEQASAANPSHTSRQLAAFKRAAGGRGRARVIVAWIKADGSASVR